MAYSSMCLSDECGGPTTAAAAGHVARVGDLANKCRPPHDHKLQMTAIVARRKKPKRKTVEFFFRKKKSETQIVAPIVLWNR